MIQLHTPSKGHSGSDMSMMREFVRMVGEGKTGKTDASVSVASHLTVSYTHLDVIIDNRLEGAGDNHGSIATEHPLIYSGDFASPEQIIPPKGVCDVNGEPIPWELCATMNNHWAVSYTHLK